MSGGYLDQDLRFVSRLTDIELEAVRGYRAEASHDTGPDFEANTPAATVHLTDEQIISRVSDDASDLVINQEIGSRRAYENAYCRPTWPKGASGLTIGIGYDIGYATIGQFQNDWDGKIPASQIDRLAVACGVKGQAAQSLPPKFYDIIVPWDAAMDVFRHKDIPYYGKMVLRAFPKSEGLHAHCFGALFSLVYNCGPRMTDNRPGDREEFRNIRDDLQAGHLPQIPGEFRSMKRLWQGTIMTGLLKRREAEAKLFEKGLAAAALAANPPVATTPTPTVLASSQAAPHLESAHAGGGDSTGWGDDFESDEPVARLEARNAEWDAVHWPANDEDSPDYRHIAHHQLSGTVFQLSADDLDLLFAANSFKPNQTENRILFALRGAQLVLGPDDIRPMLTQVDRPFLTLRDMRPDHHTFRCVLGVYNLTTRRLSGYVGNTVPCPKAVVLCRHDQDNSNLLPCGAYSFYVGTHTGRPGCFIEAAPKCVLRTKNDLAYDIHDVWDACSPVDDIHPAFDNVSAPFSSWGCQNVRGTCPKGTDQHGGEWKDFRAAAGLTKPGDGDHGRKFDYVLLTGLEAAIAVDLRKRGAGLDSLAATKQLRRLRQGSKGPLVERLQSALGLPVTGIFDHMLKKRLADVQNQQLHWADGVFSAEMENTLQLPALVFNARPAAVAGAAAAGATIAAAAAAPAVPDRALHESVAAARYADEFESLYYELGNRARVAETNPEYANTAELPYHESVFQELSVGDVTSLGRRLYKRIEFSARGLICGDSGDDKVDRDAIQQRLTMAASDGADKVESLLAVYLSSHLGLLMPVAVPAAKLIVKRVLRPSMDEMGRATVDSLVPKVNDLCKRWIVVLRDREADTAAAGPSSKV